MLFDVEDYPDWVEEVAQYFNVSDKVTDQSIWIAARQSEEPPHIGNIVVNDLFYYIEEKIQETCTDLGIKVEMKYEANALGSYFTVDYTDYTDGEDIVRYLNELAGE